MTRRPCTDFEACGLSPGPHHLSGRFLVLTVDCEAFNRPVLPLWVEAMRLWAMHAKRSGLRSCFFLSVEDMVKLRLTDQDAHGDFLKAMRALDDTGSLFYPHNHYVFDPTSGERFALTHEPQRPAESYGKRPSVFWDAVHRHQLDLGSWLTTVREVYETALSEAACQRPSLPVFRAGGWDYGDSCQDLRQYIQALYNAGFRADSSACRGIFGTPTWRIGSEFGFNIFWLDGGLLEIAPTWSLDMSIPRPSLPYLGNLLSLWRQPQLWMGHSGAFVAVLHFDHLFRQWLNGVATDFAVADGEIIEERIDHTFRLIGFLQSMLRLECVTFDDLGAP